MKKYLMIIFLLSGLSTTKAGEVRINLYGGYVLDDKFESFENPYNYFNGKIKGGFQYGAGVELVLPPFNGVELLYIGQQTTAPTSYYPENSTPGETTKVLDLTFNYLLVGFNRYFLKEGSKVEPFGGLAAGVLLANAHDPATNADRDATKFSWAIRAGANFYMSEKFGLKFHTMLLSTTQAAGGTLYFGSGGYGPGTTTASSMLQFSFSAGIVYRIFKGNSGE
jgi:hypothetical protein